MTTANTIEEIITNHGSCATAGGGGGQGVAATVGNLSIHRVIFVCKSVA